MAELTRDEALRREAVADRVMAALAAEDIRRSDMQLLVHREDDAYALTGLTGEAAARAHGDYERAYLPAAQWRQVGARVQPSPALRAAVVDYLREVEVGYFGGDVLWDASGRQETM